MRFHEQLSWYMKTIGCNSRELSKAAGIGAATISRYLSGKRKPSPDSPQLDGLVRGLAQLAAGKSSRENQGGIFSEEEIRIQFRSLLNKNKPEDYGRYLTNLSALLGVLGIKKVNLAHFLHMDPSHVSRILSGERRAVDTEQFTGDVISYIIKHSAAASDLAAMASLYGCAPEALEDPFALRAQTVRWLGSDAVNPAGDSVCSFLGKLDNFDLNDFMRSVHFEEVEIASPPASLPETKYYYGISEMMHAELDFLGATVRSPAMEDIILYSDMPMMEMSGDREYMKQFLFGTATLLQKGLRLHNIHNVYRPLPEMLLGMEGWIPMYMTGQISPYYLKEPTDRAFLHQIRSAGTVALSGEGIAGKHAHGRYLFTTRPEDVLYYRHRAEDLLKMSRPLMDIFQKEQEVSFHSHMKKLRKKPGEYRFIGSAPPLFTMSAELLRRILAHNPVDRTDEEKILHFHRYVRSDMENDNKSTWNLELSEGRFSQEKGPIRLNLSWLFLTEDVFYTEEEYGEHLRQTVEYAAAHPAMSVSVNSRAPFRNIDVMVVKGQYALISKCNAPAIHFAIYHPKIVDAFEYFVPTIY